MPVLVLLVLTALYVLTTAPDTGPTWLSRSISWILSDPLSLLSWLPLLCSVFIQLDHVWSPVPHSFDDFPGPLGNYQVCYTSLFRCVTLDLLWRVLILQPDLSGDVVHPRHLLGHSVPRLQAYSGLSTCARSVLCSRCRLASTPCRQLPIYAQDSVHLQKASVKYSFSEPPSTWCCLPCTLSLSPPPE